jgi:photoactive yellow protein
MANDEHLVGRTDIERIERFGEPELDQLPFGAIHLDKEGKILSYNQAEAALSGRKREKVVGKNFFTDIASCTDVQELAGTFREGVRKGAQMEPRQVWVTLFYSNETDTAWVFVRDDRRISQMD